MTSDNSKLKPYRGEVTREAMAALKAAGILEPVAGKHVPVRLAFNFFLAKPVSVPKKRCFPVIRPDLDKICRSSIDSLTGILYTDDAQIVELSATKFYGSPERVEVTMTVIDGMDLF